jgi:hypothetical protein
MSKAQSEEFYELRGRDLHVWLEYARSLQYSAEVLRDHLLSRMDVPPVLRRVETLGLVHSTMLLLGLAAENLIKGVYVAQNPGLVTREKLDRSLWTSDGGHGIKDFARSLLTLEPEEVELLGRLQEHVVWAGRYPIPTKSSRYYDSEHPQDMLKFNTIDFQMAERLFEKLIVEMDRAHRTHESA